MRHVLAAAALCLPLAACTNSAPPKDEVAPSSAPPSPTVQVSARPARVDDVLGAWTPLELFHKREKWRMVGTNKPLTVTFRTRAGRIEWGSTDGCNDAGGTGSLTAEGWWTPNDDAFSTLRGCVTSIEPGAKPWPSVRESVDAVLDARRIEVRGEQLAFLSASGNVLGLYQRLAGSKHLQFATCKYVVFRGHRYEWSRLAEEIMPGVGAPLGTATGHGCGGYRATEVKVYSYMEVPVQDGLTTSDSAGVHVYDRAD